MKDIKLQKLEIAALEKKAVPLVKKLLTTEGQAQAQIVSAWKQIVMFAVTNADKEGLFDAIRNAFEDNGMKDPVLATRVSEIRTCARAFEAEPKKAAAALKLPSKAQILEAVRALNPSEDRRGPKQQDAGERAQNLATSVVNKVAQSGIKLAPKQKLSLLLVRTASELIALGVSPATVRSLVEKGIETAQDAEDAEAEAA